MPLFYPAIRIGLLRGFEQEKMPSSNNPLFGKKKKDMVLIPFQHAPYQRQFRWDKKWWTKINFKAGLYQGHQFELAPDELVGVYLKDLNTFEREHVVKDQ